MSVVLDDANVSEIAMSDEQADKDVVSARIQARIVPGGANEDEQSQERRRERLGLSHEDIQEELLAYLQGAGVTIETLERWTVERGHMQNVARRLAEKIVALQNEVNSLHFTSQEYDNVLGHLGKLLGLPRPKSTP